MGFLSFWRRCLQAALLLVFLLGQANPPAALALELAFAPVSGSVTSPFGWRADPINGNHRFHGGIDIAARAGMPVYAPQAGRVMFSGYYGGYGNVVVLDHGGTLYTLYGHNSRLSVKAGEFVQRGQQISEVGSTGRSTGPHLHFEVHYNRQYVNPVKYLGLLQGQNQALVQAKPAAQVVQPVTSQQVTQPARAKKRARRTVQLVSGTDVRNIEF